MEKTWIENLDKEKINYLEDILNKSTEYNNSFAKKLKMGTQTENDFHSSSTRSLQLKETYTESFIIKASYENINEITNNKYIKNKYLRNKNKSGIILRNNKFNYRNTLTNLPNYNFISNFSIKNKNVEKKKQGLNITIQSVSSKNKSNLLLPQFKTNKKFRLSVKNNKDKLNRTTILNEENDISFYDKYNIINSNAHDFCDEQPTLKKKKKQDTDY